MQIKLNPQVQTPQFKAVNKKYFDWAVEESRWGHAYGELLFQLGFDVSTGDLSARDGLDTLYAIKKIMPKSWHESIETDINYVKSFLA